MHKLYSSSSTSSMSNNLFYNDFSLDEFTSDMGIIKPDPTELFELDGLPSIQSDLLKIASDKIYEFESLDFDKYETRHAEIRNGDCMWSGTTGSTGQNSAASSFSDSVTTADAVPLAAITGNTQNIINNIKITPNQQHQQQQTHELNQQIQVLQPTTATTIVITANSNNKQQQTNYYKTNTIAADDYEQQLQQHSIPNGNNNNNNSSSNSRTMLQQQQQSMQHIPPGTSLLRKSNNHNLQQQQQKKLLKYITSSSSIPKLQTNEFSRDRDMLLATTYCYNNTNNINNTTKATNGSALFIRPDTPHSLDDTNDSANILQTEFKHTVDLRACVMGSNNISLASGDPSNVIDHLSRELQNTSKNEIDFHFGANSLNEVLDIIGKDNYHTSTTSSSLSKKSSKMSMGTIAQLTAADDDDCDDDSDDGGESIISGVDSCGSVSPLQTIVNDDMDDLTTTYNINGGQTSPISQESCYSTNSSISSSSSSSHHHQQQHHRHHNLTPHHHHIYHHSDHSYTRCKDGMDDSGPSLETPSDSDEEIDVVSIGENKLPTNPSDKDRRALQTKVARRCRVVKTANGVRTIPPRRRMSYELPYTPASSSPVKSVANSRYPSPASTPYQHYMSSSSSTSSSSSSASSTSSTMSNVAATAATTGQAQKYLLTTAHESNNSNTKDKQRKRQIASATANGLDYVLPPNKKYRSKKSSAATTAVAAAATTATAAKQQQVTPTKTTSNQNNAMVNSTIGGTATTNHSNAAAAAALKRHYSLDEADTIEKRNLHNDMERQRRIGLKNLFEALKKQIPSIKDKERAPKVNILREAAKLCEQLTAVDREMNEQRALLKEEVAKKQEMLSRLRLLHND